MEDKTLLQNLSKHPALKERLEKILEVVNSEEIELADTAEERLIEEGRQFNREALQSWAEEQVEIQGVRFEQRHKKKIHKDSKKN